ncbi:MAG: penicillin-binding protein activator [Halieaceae bacterium]|jgi:uncharacterized protein|nr:penicillin-binding protein activator [Halieaceae bacterium]
MRSHFPKCLPRLKYCGLLLIASALIGCQSTPSEQPKPTQTPTVQQPKETLQPQVLPGVLAPEFMEAELQLLRFDWMAASAILDTLPVLGLSALDIRHLHYLQARILYLRGDAVAASEQIKWLAMSTPKSAIADKIMNFRRYMLSLSGNYLESARLGDSILTSTRPPEARRVLMRSIWKDLHRLTIDQLQSASGASTDDQWSGWLELAQLAAMPLSNPGRASAITRWRSNNAHHPAAITLPGGLIYALEQPVAIDRVSLLLPLSGRLAPAAKAILDGYLSSYYAATAHHEVEVLDITAYDSVLDAYQTAVAGGSNLVVGPLSKQSVEILASWPGRSVAVIALNRIDKALPVTSTALVQLSLAPEDEAEQIAELAFGRGDRRALVIRPSGSWGEKMESALSRQWTELGGTIVTTASYTGQEDYSSNIKSALNLPESEQRARSIRRLLATNVEFTARRRQDVDAVFMLSKSGTEARSLKPLLAYHYAANLPVYATSSIYHGTPDQRDRDLNGINLVEIPWLLGANTSTRAAITKGGTGSDNYARLNALGADAFLLQSSFSQLQAGPDTLIRGSTGLLTLNPQLHVRRELLPATFDRGELAAQ